MNKFLEANPISRFLHDYAIRLAVYFFLSLVSVHLIKQEYPKWEDIKKAKKECIEWDERTLQLLDKYFLHYYQYCADLHKMPISNELIQHIQKRWYGLLSHFIPNIQIRLEEDIGFSSTVDANFFWSLKSFTQSEDISAIALPSTMIITSKNFDEPSIKQLQLFLHEVGHYAHNDNTVRRFIKLVYDKFSSRDVYQDLHTLEYQADNIFASAALLYLLLPYDKEDINFNDFIHFYTLLFNWYLYVSSKNLSKSEAEYIYMSVIYVVQSGITEGLISKPSDIYRYVIKYCPEFKVFLELQK